MKTAPSSSAKPQPLGHESSLRWPLRNPVDPFDRQPDVIVRISATPLCYHPHGSARAVLPLARVEAVDRSQ
jgi:hypothetical protein